MAANPGRGRTHTVEIDYQEATMSDLIHREELDRLDLSDVSSGRTLPLVTPGEVLRMEFMAPAGLSARALARALDVPANRITSILNGERAITADTAILPGEQFGTSAEFWVGVALAVRLSRFQLPDHLINPPAEVTNAVFDKINE